MKKANMYIANTSSDTIHVIDYNELQIVDEISLCNQNRTYGPCSICDYKESIIASNLYDNSITIIQKRKPHLMETYYIGSACCDVKVFGDKAYIICADSNTLVEFNLIDKEIVEIIPLGNCPSYIELCKQKGILAICNVLSDEVIIMDVNDKKNYLKIIVGANPIKVRFSMVGDLLYVCESNFTGDSHGIVSIVSLKSKQIIERIPVGQLPLDIMVYKNYLFVSCYGDGSVRIIDINTKIEVGRIMVGGMPKDIFKINEHIYINEHLSKSLLKVQLKEENKKAIFLGGEANGIILA
ncbi:hypothetical protein [Clostridium cellulovorans]|uniref:40-residue YVTN family beta-propeller repeat protein n=1 Tax=Clostridium cellulovorans (strain ATCC 35296 / DSM 3052 / OCM 3 / 743B) TaxID=573061 RepID=D9SLY7_CLOC7|nr:hypothetical protein [Clostridium cellulovorans]ADL51718.1 hypothetical protein Clocel_1974 [Clostridium cellulovorans 743B]